MSLFNVWKEVKIFFLHHVQLVLLCRFSIKEVSGGGDVFLYVCAFCECVSVANRLCVFVYFFVFIDFFVRIWLRKQRIFRQFLCILNSMVNMVERFFFYLSLCLVGKYGKFLFFNVFFQFFGKYFFCLQ